LRLRRRALAAAGSGRDCGGTERLGKLREGLRVTSLDPHAWHALAPLPPESTRRRRRLDVLAPGPGGLHAIDAHFRDMHVDGEGRETVVHEYAAHGFVDARHRRIADLSAEALVLPWVECPAAVAGAERLQGTTFDDVRLRVRDELVGTASCTHLNDTLRSLADLDALLPRAAL
jgi:Protein of unknown function (DUF2889)